jgi:hypothetical protein
LVAIRGLAMVVTGGTAVGAPMVDGMVKGLDEGISSVGAAMGPTAAGRTDGSALVGMGMGLVEGAAGTMMGLPEGIGLGVDGGLATVGITMGMIEGDSVPVGTDGRSATVVGTDGRSATVDAREGPATVGTAKG